MFKKYIILILFFSYGVAFAQDVSHISNLIEQENWLQAEKELKSAINKNSIQDTTWLYTSLIYVLNSQSKEDEAIQTGREGRKKYPNLPAIGESLSYALVKKGSSILESDSRQKEALELCKEAYEILPNETNSIWFGLALKKNKDYINAIRVFKEAKNKFPKNSNFSKNLAYTQFDYGIELVAKNDYLNAEQNFKEAYAEENKDYMLYQLVVVLRAQNKFSEAIDLLEAGNKNFPKNELLKNTLPYTRFLRFNELLTKESPEIIKKEVTQTLNYVERGKPFKDQYHYQRIITKGVEFVSEISFHEQTFKSLLKILPDDPDVYDLYGFTYYTVKSKKGIPSKEDRQIAIELRRKAIKLYEKLYPNRREILNVPHPLNGRYEIIAEFGGTAMTHNGLANYCYDFIAVDEAGEYFKKGTSGKSNDDYFNFNQPVYSIADGEVIDILTNQVDNKPGDFAYSGNYISIKHKDYISFYAHLKKDSSTLAVGSKVKTGEIIGRAGNSGMSRESHLHFCLNDSNWVSIPFRFKDHKVWKGQQFRLNNDPIHEGEIVELISPK